jgi:hypothetical protein
VRKQYVHWHKQGRIPRAVSPGPAQAACSVCLKSRCETARGPYINWQVANGPAPPGQPAATRAASGSGEQAQAGPGRTRREPDAAAPTATVAESDSESESRSRRH